MATMSYSNISDILLEVNKDGSNQKSALALSSISEIEIKNLLKQVDTMIHHKKLRWERQKQEMDNKLQLKEQEFQIQKDTINQKNIEIGQLRKLLQNMESTTQEILKKYEKEIANLNQQLNKLKSEYVKMQRKSKRDTPPRSDGNIGQNVISNALNNSSEIFRIDSSTSGSACSTLNPAKILPLQTPPNLTFINKNNFHDKLDHQQDAVSSKMLNNKDHINHAKSRNVIQIHSESRPTTSKNIETIKVHHKPEEHKNKELKSSNEIDNLKELVEFYKISNQELTRKYDELSKKISNDAENEAAHKDKTTIDFYKQEIHKRDEIIKQMEVLDKADNIELQYFKDEVKKYKKQEAKIINDMEKMKKDYEDAMKRLENIELENKKIKSRAQHNEEKNKSYETMRKKYEQERERHIQEVNSLKNQINTFSDQLADKSSQIRSLTEKSSNLERQLREKDEQLAKVNQELTITVAHIEALRLENNFLKQSLLEKKSDEKDIVEMQKKYHHVLELTEKENKRLKGEIVSLTEWIESIKNSNLNSKHSLRHGYNKDMELTADFDQRRSKAIREDYEKQIESLKKQHEISVKRLNNEIEKLHSEKHGLLAELDNKLSHQHNYNCADNLLKTNHHNNFSGLHKDSINSSLSVGTISSKNHSNSFLNCNPINDENLKNQNNIYRFSDDQLRLNSDDKIDLITPNKTGRASSISDMRYDEQGRKKDLESMLETHIEQLRRSSEEQRNKNRNLH